MNEKIYTGIYIFNNNKKIVRKRAIFEADLDLHKKVLLYAKKQYVINKISSRFSYRKIF